MPIAEGFAVHRQRLAQQWLSLTVLTLDAQLIRERVQGKARGLTIRTLLLEPVAQQLDAQRVAVVVHALNAAVGCVIPLCCAPPGLKAVLVDPLGGAAAGAGLHERAVLFAPEAQSAPLLLCIIQHLLALLALYCVW